MTHKFSAQVRSATANSFLCLQSAALQPGVWIVHVAAHCHAGDEKRGETLFVSNKLWEVMEKIQALNHKCLKKRNLQTFGYPYILLVFKRKQITFT